MVEHVYAQTRNFPREELFGLTSQMRRAAVFGSRKIAEGAARSGTKELMRFLSIAEASLSELDTHVEIAFRLGFLKDNQLQDEIDAVAGLLLGLSASIRKKLG